MASRADRHNNPAAFITSLARGAGLVLGQDYEVGDPFQVGDLTLYTARLLGDPIALTIRVIDSQTYYTTRGTPRWTYIAIPKFVWDGLSFDQKKQVIAFHYQHEGGTALKGLFS